MERSAKVVNNSPFSGISHPSYSRVAPKPSVRDISFSSYLNTDLPTSRLSHRVAADDGGDAELSIFDAEKYFNDTADQKTPPSQPPEKIELGRASSASASSIDGYGRNYRAATPTAFSDASWNSQTGLLSNPPGSKAVSMRLINLNTVKKCPSSPRRWLFRPTCPCSGDKSVQVQETFSPASKPHSSSNNQHLKIDQQEALKRPMVTISAEEWTKDETLTTLTNRPFTAAISARKLSDGGGFTFPILAHPPPGNNQDDTPRESLEVFRPPQLLLRTSPATLYPGDVAGRRSFTFAGEDDAASDSSSDLFEIESFSTSTGGGGGGSASVLYRARDSLDELVRCAAATGSAGYRYSLDETSTTVGATEAYEPSEASVEWSVVTAEGFDRASLANFSASASEFGEARLAAEVKKKGGGFLSCRCEKAVNVGPPPFKQGAVGPVGHDHPVCGELGRASLMASLAVLHVKPPLPRSNSARLGARPFVAR